MGLTAEQLHGGLETVAKRDPAIARALKLAGRPEPRIRDRGYRTLLRTIVGQQVSVAAASSMWCKLEAALGEDML
ncbi:MAG: DNA-3-methyladenine glycosylase 2 family protein, partial [Croceibacterium sp.]